MEEKQINSDKKGLKDFLEQSYKRKLSEIEVSEYKDRLVKFFALLMEIDRRENVTKFYDKPNK